MRRILRTLSAAAAGHVCAAAPGVAQDYPSKPVRILVVFQPGGPTDIITRVLADHLTRAWGQPVVAEFKPGAAGNLAADLTAKAPADGHTLNVTSMVVPTIFKHMYDKLNYDPEADLVAISGLTRTPMVLEVNLHVPVRNYDDFVGYMKKEAGKLNFGSPGIGTMPHLAAELVRAKIGVASVHIPYRGGTPFLDAFLKNEVQWSVDVLQTAVAQRERIRPIAVTSAARIPDLPDVPSIVELGHPDLEAYSTFILVGPKGIPKPVVDKIAAEVGRALREPASIDRLRAGGIYAHPAPPEETVRFLDGERAKWVPIVKANNIRAE